MYGLQQFTVTNNINMNSLISIRTNIIYEKVNKENDLHEDEYKRFNELIFLVDKPVYKFSNEGEIIRERVIEEFRFIVYEKNFDTLIKMLTNLKDATEKDLK